MPIMDNFGSQFIDEATQSEHGLMSANDKVKLDNIKLDDIKYIQNGLNEINEYIVPQVIYGIKIDPTNPDPNTSVTYTDNATGFIPLKVNQTTGECDYGSWKDIIDNILGIKPCLVKSNGTVVTYLDPNDYNKTINGNTTDITGTLGQVMIRFKHTYYKFSIDGDKIWFQISNKQTDSTWVDTAFATEDGIGTIRDEMFISAYESVQKNNILQSVSNDIPLFKLSYEEIEELSKFGVFNMMNITKKQFIIFLGYLVTKSIDLEGNIGKGNIDSANLLETGTMNTKGLFYGKSTANEGVKLFGIENLWGNQLKYMHGIAQKLVYVLQEDGLSIPEQHIYIKEFYPYNNIEDFDDVGKISPNISGYISSIKFISDSIYLPDTMIGSTSTYFKSYFQNGESLNANHKLYGLYGGSNVYGDKAGSEFLLLAYLDEQYVQATTHIVY